MKQFKVGILGATGAVGREMMKILEERKFPVAELRPIASERSVGTKLPFNGGEAQVVAASDSAFAGLDLVLGAAENDIAKRYAPAIVKAGACLWITPAHSGWIRMCRWLSLRSIPRM